MNDAPVLLRVRDMSVAFGTGTRRVPAVRGVSLEVREGEIVALVGESGSGKSTIGLALLGLADGPHTSVTGKIELHRKNGDVVDIATLTDRALRGVRGDDVAMIFQEPMSSLNPIYTIGWQIEEVLKKHRPLGADARRQEALACLRTLAVPSPEKCLVSYPHQLSGGVMIAMALAGHPRLLIADEPTTALDVTIQAQIVAHLKALQRQTGMAILFITHDLALVAEIADRVLVMYAGQIVETGPADALFTDPRMPYTRALLRARPRLDNLEERIRPIPGTVPDVRALPSGCAFHPRCADAHDPGACTTVSPALEAADGQREVRCLRWRDLAATRP
jgi:oligopeptide/dipeptide ABC transporter ATP-binding protein